MAIEERAAAPITKQLTSTNNNKETSKKDRDSLDIQEDDLVQIIHDPVRIKDFSNEIRAIMDVEEFVHQGTVLVKQQQPTTNGLVDEKLVENLLSQSPLASDDKQDIIEEIKQSLFIKTGDDNVNKPKQGGCRMLSKVIRPCQVNANSAKDSNERDLSWLIAYTSIGQQFIKRRSMILVQFKRYHEPSYLDQKAVNLLMIIVAPSGDKETKSAYEAARTFATLFNYAKMDPQHSKVLLDEGGKTESSLKAAIMIKAKELYEKSKSNQFMNRHKYSFPPIVSVYLDESKRQQNKKNNQLENGIVLSNSKYVTVSLNPMVNGADENGAKDEPIMVPAFMETRASVALTQSLDKNNNNVMSSCDKGPDDVANEQESAKFTLSFGSIGEGILADLKRRIKYYPSDFKDAFVGPQRTLQKTISTIWFLYFGILLPIIAFNSLNHTQTEGHLGDLKKSIIGQAVGGLFFASFSGQPLVIIMTTAPLCLYTKVIYSMCQDYGFNFTSMYALVGIWNCIFLTIYSLFNFSKLMKWCTRSTEEIFAMFIVVAFILDAFKNMLKNFDKFYFSPACDAISPLGSIDLVNQSHPQSLDIACQRDSSILFLLLMLATVWLATLLYRFHKTPYFASCVRLFLSDYALPIAVVVISFLGSYVFDKVRVEPSPASKELQFTMANLDKLPITGHILAMGLGFTLSILFFMDQNISAAMVVAPQNNLKKGPAYHYDLLIVGLLNAFLTLFGLPMMHGVLPHSPLHVRSLADIEERLENGHKVERVSNVRENRVTALVAHLLILASLYLIPYPIEYIPRAVLNGLFLYMAITSLDGLRIFERILLIFTQQTEYPPSHYIRSCPQRTVHLFTFIQLIQLLVMCLLGFSPINAIEMFFPVIILLMVFFRHKIVPRYIEAKYLEKLDGHQH